VAMVQSPEIQPLEGLELRVQVPTLEACSRPSAPVPRDNVAREPQ